MSPDIKPYAVTVILGAFLFLVVLGVRLSLDVRKSRKMAKRFEDKEEKTKLDRIRELEQ